VSAPEYAPIRSSTANHYELSLAATEEFGNRLLEYLSRASTEAPSTQLNRPSQVVEISSLVLAEVVRTGCAGQALTAKLSSTIRNL
jgi:hypothetical protein